MDIRAYARPVEELDDDREPRSYGALDIESAP
jgi:hypothetical protein